MRDAKVLLLLLLTMGTAIKCENVGFLLSSADSYKTALKDIVSYALPDDSQITILTEEYNATMRSIIDACCRLVEGNVSVVIAKSTSSATAIQADILSPLKIPLIAVSATDPHLPRSDRKYLIRMSPSDTHQSRAIFDILQYYHWTRISILASSDSYGVNGILELQRLVMMDSSIIVDNILFFDAYTETVNVTQELTVLSESLSKVVVLNCAGTFAKLVLDTAHSMGLMDGGYAWIVTDSIASQPEILSNDGAFFNSFYEGLLGVRPSIVKNPEYQKLKDNYLQKNHTLAELNSYTLLAYDAVGFVNSVLGNLTTPAPSNIDCYSSDGWNDGDTVLSHLLNLNYAGVTGLINFTDSGDSTRIAYDVVNFRDDQFQKLGAWFDGTGLEMTGSAIFLGNLEEVPSAVADNLIGEHLYLGVKAEGPFMYFATEDCEGNGCWTGLCMDIVNQLSHDLGFTYEYLEPEDGYWGGYNETTAEWNGMVGELINGRIDAITVHLSTNSARKGVIDFSFPFMDASIVAVVKGTAGTENNFFFFTPFKANVWGSILVANFFIILLMSLYSKLSPFGKYGAKMHAMQTCTCETCETRRINEYTQNNSLEATPQFDCLVDEIEAQDKTKYTSLFNSAWQIGTGLVAQAAETLPYCVSGRFLLLTWWFFMLLIISLYTANLTAFLTLSNMGINLNSVLDLLGQEEYEWGTISSSHPETLLRIHKDSSYNKLVEQGVALASVEEALERVRNGKFVFIDETPVIAHNLKQDCNVFSIGDEFQSFEYAFGYAINSPYARLLDSYILRYRENGYLDGLWKKWSSGSEICSNTVGSTSTLDMAMLAGMFYILAAGVAVSLVLIVVELIYASVLDSVREPGIGFWAALGRRLRLRENALGFKRSCCRTRDSREYSC